MFHYTLIERYLEDTSKILGDFFVLSGKAKLNAAFDELSHYDLKDPNGFAEFLITANIGLVRAKFPGCFQFQKRTTRSITVFLSICVHFKQMVIGCDQILFSVGRSRSRFKHLILNDFDSFTSHYPRIPMSSQKCRAKGKWKRYITTIDHLTHFTFNSRTFKILFTPKAAWEQVLVRSSKIQRNITAPTRSRLCKMCKW